MCISELRLYETHDQKNICDGGKIKKKKLPYWDLSHLSLKLKLNGA